MAVSTSEITRQLQAGDITFAQAITLVQERTGERLMSAQEGADFINRLGTIAQGLNQPSPSESPVLKPAAVPGTQNAPLQPTGLTVEQVEADFKAGILTDAQVTAALQSLVVHSPTTVLAHWRAGGTGLPSIGPPELGAGGGLLGPTEGTQNFVPRPDPIFTPSTGTENVSRGDIFAGQDFGNADFRRRLIGETFGTGLTPIGQKAAGRAFSQFGAQSPITGFGSSTPRAEAFRSFVQNRPTPASLAGNIQQILAGGAENPDFENAFRTSNDVITAGIQPRVLSASPHLQAGLADVLGERARTNVALSPENFQTPEQLFELLQTLSNAFPSF